MINAEVPFVFCHYEPFLMHKNELVSYSVLIFIGTKIKKEHKIVPRTVQIRTNDERVQEFQEKLTNAKSVYH